MIGAEPGEVMAAAQTALLADSLISTLANAAFGAPAMAEGLSLLFSNVPPRSHNGPQRKLLSFCRSRPVLLARTDHSAKVGAGQPEWSR